MQNGDVHGCVHDGTSVINVFQIQLRNIFNLLRHVTQNFIVNCSSEKFELKVCGKVPFLILSR